MFSMKYQIKQEIKFLFHMPQYLFLCNCGCAFRVSALLEGLDATTTTFQFHLGFDLFKVSVT